MYSIKQLKTKVTQYADYTETMERHAIMVNGQRVGVVLSINDGDAQYFDATDSKERNIVVNCMLSRFSTFEQAANFLVNR